MRMIPMLIALLALFGCGQRQGDGPHPPVPGPWERAATAPKAVMVIAHQSFRDEELAEPRKLLEHAGCWVVVASSATSPAKGMLGALVTPDLLVKDVKVADYDAVVFVGGTGAQEYWNDPTAQQIARDAVAQGKLLGAICLAPVTLANAGVLEGKKATVWSSEAGRLKARGAEYTGAAVQVDGSIITADGPEAAKEFGRALVDALPAK